MPVRRFVQMRLLWLTLVTVSLTIVMAGLRPTDSAVAFFPFSHDWKRAQQTLDYPNSADNRNLIRANYLLDMGFLLAYGFLLRETARSRRRLTALRGRRVQQMARWAALLCIPLMLSDAAENLAALTLLGLLPNPDPHFNWLFPTVQAASALKWGLAGVVSALLGLLWRPDPGSGRRVLSWMIAALFGVGGIADLGLVGGLWAQWHGAVAILGGLAFVLPAIALLLQLAFWRSLGVLAKLGYVLRVPLLGLIILAAFGPVALGPARPWLGATLQFAEKDITAWWHLPVVSLTAFLVAFSCVAQISVFCLYGWKRLGDSALRVHYREPFRKLVRITGICAGLLLPLCATVGSYVRTAYENANWLLAVRALTSVLSGFVGAVLVLVLAEVGQARFSAPGSVLPNLIFATQRWPFIGSGIARLRAKPAPRLLAALTAVIEKVFAAAGPGYRDVNGRLLSGHLFAAALAVLSIAFYGTVVLLKAPGQSGGTSEAPYVPTVTAVLLLVLAATWLLSGLAFLLDRYRVPLLAAVIVLWFGVGGSFKSTDHVFRLGAEQQAGSYEPPTPSAVLRAYSDPVLVAAAGGGIQAAAWTTRVIQGIDNAWQGGLRRRLALLSTVSGGSVGAVYVGAYFDDLRQASLKAQESSLDEVAWGLIGPDMLRPILPRRWQYMDRGYALEATIQERVPKGDQSIRAWADKAGNSLPAFLFNSTVVETGQPVAFATTQMPSIAYRKRLKALGVKQQPVVVSSASLYGLQEKNDPHITDYGLSVATAARLSAAFPYVSPAARPAWPAGAAQWQPGNERGFHVVDGGYYDVYGLVALTQWLDDALQNMTDARPTRVTVFIIRGQVWKPSKTAPSWSWVNQTLAPPSAYLATRNYAQWAGGMEAMRLLRDKWQGRVSIEPHLLEYPDMKAKDLNCIEPPLSWKLTPVQKRCIEEAWQQVASRKDGPLGAQ